MSKVIVNKKKISNNLIIKFFIFIIIIIITISFLYWLIHNKSNSKFVSNYLELISNKYNYVLNEVEINGLENIPIEEINQYFLEYYGKSIFLLPLREISKKIDENHWVKSISIKNNFKNKVIINLIELQPIAVYFNGKNYVLINEFGNIIDFANNKHIQQYIVLTGDHSKENALNLIKAIPFDLKSKIRKAEYINNRRWNIYSKENVQIKLPESEYDKAMESYLDIYENVSIADISKIEFIDLRIPERAIIKFNNNR